MRDAKEAIPELQEVVTLLPSNVANRADLGLGLLMTGETQAAEQGLRGALLLDPNNPHTQLVLGIALLENGNGEGIGLCRAPAFRGPYGPGGILCCHRRSLAEVAEAE